MKKWTRLATMAVCLGLSGVAHAAIESSDSKQGIEAVWSVLSGVNMPFVNVKVDLSGLTWDCNDSSCVLGSDARLNVLITPDGDQPIAYQQANTSFFAALGVGVVDDSLLTYPTPKGIQDPLGGVWTVSPDLASWRYGVHIQENIAPQDAQFIVSYGSLAVGVFGLPSNPLTRLITSESGWVELDPGLEPGDPYATNESLNGAGWVFSTTGQSPFVAPVYALPSLNPTCVSADCMRYERGTLMVDALRMSFGVQAVAAPVPEPSSLMMMMAGLALVASLSRMKPGRLQR